MSKNQNKPKNPKKSKNVIKNPKKYKKLKKVRTNKKIQKINKKVRAKKKTFCSLNFYASIFHLIQFDVNLQELLRYQSEQQNTQSIYLIDEMLFIDQQNLL